MSSTEGDAPRDDDRQTGYDATQKEQTDPMATQEQPEPEEGGSDETMADRPIDAVRAAKKENLLRDFNERIEAHHKWVGSPLSEWACECFDENCSEPVQMTNEEYEAVRARPTHFLIAPTDKHLIPRIERVVQREERFWVIEKVGVGAAISEELDPRSP